ncbi:hypothetical protein EV424DRAFT_1539731 [Suillus variegatus]|nr:hypothetical protein EV424DRAFT_1539731 [Suillus variegatus]
MSQIRVLTRKQRDMLKTFLPGYVLVNSGTAEETAFWESVYSKWFETWPEHDVHYADIPPDQLSGLQQALLNTAIERRCRMPQKKWATPEQEEFLLGHFPEFRKHAVVKRYRDFLKRVGIEWFQRWPERQALFPEFPADHVYTAEEEQKLAAGIETRHQASQGYQIASWFRWQNNPICLGRSAAVRGVLKFDTVLAGGVNLKGTRAPQKIDVYSNKYYKEKIKHAADDAIEKEHITNRGPKLQKRREITRHIYSDESEAVKAKIDKKYEKIKARYVKQRQCLKSGKPPKIDDMSKIKAIQELGPMLDRVLKYLSHMTGGWKFSVLMGGHDPSTGEVSVFNYHVGEVESGAQFDQVYGKFDAVHSAFLEFVKNSIIFDSTSSQEPESDEDEDEEPLSDLDEDEGWGKSGDESGQGLYRMTPQSDGGVNLPPNDNPPSYANTTSDASFNASFGLDSQAAATHLDNIDFSVLDPPADPIITGDIDFSAFDPTAFLAVMNDPAYTDLLNSSDAPPVDSHPNAYLSESITQTPEVLLPPRNNEEVLLPPGNNEEVLLPPGNDDYTNVPAAPHGRRRNRVDGTQAPAPSTEQQAPRLRVRNSVPFNPRERDNEIGASTRHIPTSVAAKDKRKNAENNSGSHKRARQR